MTQGRTRKLYFHDVSDKVVIVDAPGYGYKRFPKFLDWERLVRHYIENSERLALIVSLINSQHGVKQTDQEWLQFLSTVKKPVLPLLTKCDKLSSLPQVSAAFWHETRQYGACLPYILSTSSKTQLGLQELRAVIVEAAVKDSKPS